jgi:hypothetical protein
MENLFKPGKWLVLFCGLFVLLWGVLQYVSNARLKEEAERWGAIVFTWNWPGDQWSSRAEMTEASVLRKTDHDAVVRIKGKQYLTAGVPGDKLTNSEAVDCAAVLTFYKRSVHDKDYWELGEVEFP